MIEDASPFGAVASGDSPAEDRPGSRRPDLRAGAKALIATGDGVLLVKERRDDGSTFWTLPGGGVEGDESPAECLRRELGEELQCRCVPGKPVAACAYRHTSRPGTVSVYTVVAGELVTEPTPNPREGVVDCAWGDPGDLPPGTLRPFRRLLDRLDVDGPG